MAYFHCLIGGGSSGGGYELTVTCDADFAGTTITATDGVTTLTQTCPSASPYEVVFDIPNGGDWTISGVVGGRTVSTGVNIPTSASLFATVQQTVTIYSAKEDTISYTDIDGATQTITFASGETSKQVQIAIEPSGNSFTFTSSVAKNPDNLSQDYSKTFTITTSTTELYLMPDAVKTLYWWGYISSNCEAVTTANGWVATSLNVGLNPPTMNTNDVYTIKSGGNDIGGGIGAKDAITINANIKAITKTTTTQANTVYLCITNNGKNMIDLSFEMIVDTSVGVRTLSPTTKTGIRPYFSARSGNGLYIYALWYE